MLEKLGVPAAGRADPDLEAATPPEPWTCPGSCWGSCCAHLRRVLATAPAALPRTRPDPDRHPARRPTAAADHLLALPCRAASQRCAPTADRHAAHARTGLGGGQRATAVVTVDTDTTVHTLFGQPDGRAQGLQPEEQGQEELPAHPQLHRRDARVRGGRVAQWRPAQREADLRSSAECPAGLAAGREADLRPG